VKNNTYDYVIVGAGSAGCVLANRLAARRDLRVLLLEAGGRDSSPFIHMPAGIARLAGNPRVDWSYYTEPEPNLLGRRLYWPRGRVLGGSSSINAMCYTRGHPQDYDEWARLVDEQWSYANVLPFFKKSERQAHAANEYHGSDGPLSVENLKFRNPLSEVFVAAGVELGLRRNLDFNGPIQDGVGFYQVTQCNGRRCSSARGFLRPVESKANLFIHTRCLVTRVLFRGTRAIGVECRQNGVLKTVHAEREVILAAGAIASPQLLQLSGIGPPDALHALGIRVIVPAIGVGSCLHDHLDFCTLYKCTRSITYDFSAWQEVTVALRYLLTRSGPGVTNVAEAGAFVRTPLAIDERPDVQLHFVPAQLDDHGRNRLPGHGFTVHACGLRPESRGRITLRSNRPDEPPIIQPNYLSVGNDMDVLLAGIALSREIVHSAAFAPFRGPEVLPGERVQTRQELETVIRRKAETIYHPAGSCRMGNDTGAVVDSELRVRGAENLRVVDASVMPRLIGGNTNAPTIMIAEKAAAALLT
jgi:choline dehydrogenase-like flavoprotein